MDFKLHFFIFLIIFFVLGCDEELPPRNDPSKLFTGHLDVTYAYSAQENGILFLATIVNNFDETLNGKALIEGKMEIEWIVPIDRIGPFVPKRIAPLTAKNIRKARGYNNVSGKISIDPLDTVVIGYIWDFKFDDSTDIRDVPFFRIGAKNLGCGNTTFKNGLMITTNRLVYQRQSFRVKCNIKFFDNTAYIQVPERTVSSCSINFFPDSVCYGMRRPGAYETPCDLNY